MTLKTPANIRHYVDILGEDATVEFLLEFGGAPLYMAADPKGASRLVDVVGMDKARELAAKSVAMEARVPIPKQWIAQTLKSKGLPVAEIARRLHVTDVTVRKYLAGFDRPERETRQLPLF